MKKRGFMPGIHSRLLYKVAGLMLVFACALMVLAPAHAAKKSAGKVVVYNWSEYIPQKVMDDFTKETGIEVVYSTFEANEAMIAKVKLMQGKGYDVVVPSSYFLDIMKEDDLIQKIDHSKLPNLAQIDPKWLNKDFDPNNEYSVPYMWGVLGLAYNTKYIKPEQLTSWADLTRPEFKGKLIMTDDLRDAFCVGMKAKGRSCVDAAGEDIELGYQFLRDLKPSIRIFDVTAIKQALISEEVWAGPIWNGDYLVAAEENKNLAFLFPKEGVPLWMDNFVITKGAENVANAHTFINYMLRPEVAVQCVEEYQYSTPNKGALELLDEETRNNRILLPQEEELQKAEFTEAAGPALNIYQKFWEILKTGK